MDKTIVKLTVFVVILLLMAFLRTVGVSPFLVFGVGLSGAFAFLSYTRPSIREEVTRPVSVDGEPPAVGTVTTFTNVAFSEREPTWKGWPKDVGVVTITPQAITLDSKKTSLTFGAPFVADLHEHRFIKWTMVRVTGSTSAGETATAYLVTSGAPISAAHDAKAMTQEAMDLAEAINVSS